jgi:RNA polymerase sigma-70 factor (ECF subfamily)
VEELEWIKKMQQGDDTAFFIIYEKYKNAALRTAYLITGNRYTGEDILQETFVQCCLHIKELKDPATFKAWFYRILTRTAWKFAKKEKSAVPVENLFETIDESVEEDSEKTFLQKEERRKLLEAINQLDLKQRITVILYYYNEMSVSEIAKATGSLEGTVKSRLFFARKKLYQKLKADAFFKGRVCEKNG